MAGFRSNNNVRLINLADPVNSKDAVNKRWAEENLIRKAEITLTNDQIKALPTAPVVVLPATETLGYEGFPTKLPVVVKGYILLDASAGAYTNMNQANRLIFGWGSDFSSDIGVAGSKGRLGDSDPYQYVVTAVPLLRTGKSFQTVFFSEDQIADEYLQDNAIVVKLDNRGDGALTGGHADNTLKIAINYVLLDL